MAQNFAGAGVYLIQTFFGLYTFFLIFRFLMQVSRVDYYNPICQGIVKITDPAISPFRAILPSIRGVDFATLTVAFIVQLVAVMLVASLSGWPAFAPIYLAWVMLGLFATVLNLYFFALIIMVITSWVAPGSDHPAIALIYQITEPICAPARKVLPPMGGMDFSIIVVFVVINLIDHYLVVQPLAAMLGVPRGIILGL